jgi:hypothetical protein
MAVNEVAKRCPLLAHFGADKRGVPFQGDRATTPLLDEADLSALKQTDCVSNSGNAAKTGDDGATSIY